jgi:hypothetical protein
LYQKHEWTRNWSGRGIAMMNNMEYKSAKNAIAVYVPHLSFFKKLDALISAYPYNKFYKDLRNQMKHGKSLKRLTQISIK